MAMHPERSQTIHAEGSRCEDDPAARIEFDAASSTGRKQETEARNTRPKEEAARIGGSFYK
jgi:hypothetical protein